jgi:two-component system, OmpR family, response regulator RegX3
MVGAPQGYPAAVTTILLVEDEAAIGEGLTISLEAEGFRVAWVREGDRALDAWRRERPDLVLLDLMLPGLGGTEICRRLRQESDVPIVMLTAKDAEVDRVVGLELGADDYVTKPFSTRELVARIRAVLRRGREPEPAAAPTAVEAGGVRVDRARHAVVVDGAPVSLPPKEFDLLELLVEHAGLVLTREQLIDRVWGLDYVGDTKTLDVHIRRLRTRIEADPASPRRIRTVRGVGYRFDDARP